MVTNCNVAHKAIINENNTREAIFNFVIDVDNDLINNAYLNETIQKCMVCFNSGNYKTWSVKEMFYGTGDEFIYFECPNCSTLQITSIPKNINEYYPKNYYSFQKPQMLPVNPNIKKNPSMILDVGCGNGSWLCSLAANGFINLFGCDPYIENNLAYPNGVRINKCSIHDMEGEYDVIHLSHSFEHMHDPLEVFKSLNKLLKTGKGEYGYAPKIEIIIPLYPNLAFDIYGPYWYQIDAPRHFFIHSIKSIGMLAEDNDFNVESISFQGSSGQFVVSRLYQLNVPFIEYERIYTDDSLSCLKNQLPTLEMLSNLTIFTSYSDQALFTLTRKI